MVSVQFFSDSLISLYFCLSLRSFHFHQVALAAMVELGSNRSMYSCSCSFASHAHDSCYKPSSIRARLMYEASSTTASQIPADNPDCCEIPSFARGYHPYQDVWNPSVGQVLKLRKEPDNSHNCHAVAVVKSGDTVEGHVTYNLAPLSSHFLARKFNKGSIYITRERTNRGAGYGL